MRTCFKGCIKDAYLQKGDFNVFVVDWWDWSQNTDYFSVAKLINTILGNFLADFTKFLNSEGNVSFDDMYLIGHSLGAHMSGAAGHLIKPNQYNTIFGLDPAGPEFFTAPEDERLSENDAKYVEQISTNMGELGYLGVLGHSAFFPNFGRVQPNCIKHPSIACSHNLAYWYFAESINNELCSIPCPYHNGLLKKSITKFYCDTKTPCNQKILMGDEPSVPKKGTYYVKTNDNKPYGICNC